MFADLVIYNRSARAYTVVDGDGMLYEFPAGPQGKHAAVRFALQMEHSDVYAAVERWLDEAPQLERTLWKAAEIVISGGVEVFPAPRAGVVAMVLSSDGYGRYAIGQDSGGYLTCQCAHFQEGEPPRETDSMQAVCKHVGAYRLHLRTREERF